MEKIKERKKYVAPSVSVLEIGACLLQATSPVQSSPTVNGFGDGGSLGGGELESSPARKNSLWD